MDALVPLLYDEMRRLAERYLRDERSAATLQPTALVHEAYLRLVAQNLPDWESRSHFFGVAAHLMRQILVDHARQRDSSIAGHFRRDRWTRAAYGGGVAASRDGCPPGWQKTVRDAILDSMTTDS